MSSLRTFFEKESEQRRALCAVVDEGWLDPGANARLYNLSRRAFDPTANPRDAHPYFEKIYDELKTKEWNLLRPHSVQASWPPNRVFETLRSEFAEFPWGGAFNLKNLPAESVLRPRLVTMRSVKPKKGYPTMAVSKLLHFYNPTLFPIYDQAKIWNEVCNGHFKEDYRTYGNEEEKREWNYGEDDETFLPFYMRWANSLLMAAHPDFMRVFAEWFDKQTRTCEKTFSTSELYATAFEFTAIGAAATQGEYRNASKG
jgi:hypothetical protein